MRDAGHLMRADVQAFCARLGADRLMVQGAGGNASWKDGNTLWVKASGTWLADAGDKDIFVAVDLAHLTAALAAGDFGVQPLAAPGATLKPSIETLLHALMPHRVVVHLHAIEVLARLVRSDWRSDFARALPADLRWDGVDYHKPGRALAEAVSALMQGTDTPDIVFLGNHGVVIGGSTVAEIEARLAVLTACCARLNTLDSGEPAGAPAPEPWAVGYAPVGGADIQRLALDPACFTRLVQAWALYPDHVVFLGASPCVYESLGEWQATEHAENHSDGAPDLVFVRGAGVYARTGFGESKLAQLQCYRDVLVRQPDATGLHALSPEQIGELLNWDAEQYRKAMAK